MTIREIFTSIISPRINGINATKKTNNNLQATMPVLKSDVFEISPKSRNRITANKVLERSRKFGLGEFLSLRKAEKTALKKITEEDLENDAKINTKIGLKLRDKLDNEYGKNKYVFVCIGTSPSGIARVMEFSGVETKYIPISHFNQPDCLKKIQKPKKYYKEYLKYLKDLGFEKNKMLEKNKKYLFFDYTHTGTTLSNIKHILEKTLKLPPEKMEFKSLNRELESLAKLSSPDYIDELMEISNYIDKYLTDCAISVIGGVPHLPYEHLELLAEKINTENDLAKLYNFNIMNLLQEEGELRYTKENTNLI